ncbi:MAG: GAF domain-containing protein [Candidatus Lindowbacteria bacterium]|nr:GAF domain-containing protein [Candidatus Lindowbacteria bacterium]
MDPKPLSLLIAALANFALATYVFVKNPKKIANISFALFVFSVVIWSLSIFIIDIARDYEMLMFAGHLTFFGGAAMASNFLLFAFVFPQTKKEMPSRKQFFFIYGPGALAAAMALTPLVLRDITYVGDRVRPVYGKGITLYTVYCLAYTGYGFLLLARKYLSRPGRFERVQLKYTFWGLFVPVSAVVLITLILPQVGISRFSDITPLLSVVGVASISYAIVRYRLMDLGVVFRNVLIYGTLALAMAVALIGLLFVVQPLLNLPQRSAVFLASVLAAALVQPLKFYVEIGVDRYYFRGRYNYQAALTEFSSSMTRILDLEDIQNRIVHEVASILQVKSVALLLLDAEGKKYTIISSLPPVLSDAAQEFDVDSIVVRKMNEVRSPLVKEELKRILLQEFEPIREEFERIEAEVFIPLIYRGELIGLLSLGEKVSADIYSKEDLNLLGTLGNQAAVALENALLHHTVTMLKNHNDNILKYMSSGVISINRGQIIDTCNQKAHEILRLPPKGALNQKIESLPQPLRRMLTDTLTGKNRFSNQEVQILADGGAISYLSASTSHIRDEKDGVTGALLVFNDLTEIRLRLRSRIHQDVRATAAGEIRGQGIPRYVFVDNRRRSRANQFHRGKTPGICAPLGASF